jgi:hypothetical protein
MLSVIILNVVMLSVMAPSSLPDICGKGLKSTLAVVQHRVLIYEVLRASLPNLIFRRSHMGQML